MQWVCSTHWAHSAQYVLVQKGQLTQTQLTQWTWQIWVVGTITFSAKRSYSTHRGMQYDVGVGAKRSTHTLYLANMGGGDRYL